MKIIDQSPLRSEDGSISLIDRLRGIWQSGLAWDRDRQAEDRLIARLQKALDNKYTLIRSALLPKLEIPIPLILLGPTGIYVIHASAQRGIYRAKEEIWAVMDTKSRRFRAAQPNLIRRVMLLGKVVENTLRDEFPDLPEVNPVLFLGHAGIHVDAERPAVRLVRVDAADRFAASIPENPSILDRSEVKRLADALTRPIPKEERSGESLLADKSMLSIGSIRMQRRQWILIGLLVFIEVCLLVVFAAVIVALP